MCGVIMVACSPINTVFTAIYAVALCKLTEKANDGRCVVCFLS